MQQLALTFVIPLYRSAETIGGVVREIEGMTVEGGHEIVLVNDGSPDRTSEVCRALMRELAPRRRGVPITLIEHARNFGEHNAVLTGWRHARGAHIVNLDDDGQNPPAEAVRLWRPRASAAGSTSCTGTTSRSSTRPGAMSAAGSRTG